MKKRLTILMAIAAMLVFVTSCEKYKFDTYDFLPTIYVNTSDEERSDKIVEIVNKDYYFSTKHSYTATFNKAAEEAADVFDEHIEELDQDAIQDLLEYGEVLRISLWSMDPGECLLTYIFTNENVTSE